MKKIFSLFAAILFAGSMMAAATADVTYDFTGSDWSVSGSTLTNGTVSFSGAAAGSKGSFKMNSGYFIMGKQGAYLTFPTYSSAVEKIVITGRSGASGSVGQNIYVGNTAVSTATTGATGTNTYNIASTSQAAGTTYTLKVTTDHNTQITKIEIYYAAVTSAVTIGSHVGGSLEVTGASDLTKVGEGTVLTVTATPDAENHYIGGSVKVIKTGVTPEADVTSTVYNSSTGKLTMPAYAVTVSATFTPTYKINLVAEGGSIALDYTAGGAEEGYAIEGTVISAEATADGTHTFKSLEVSDNAIDVTVFDNLAEFTMPAAAVTVTATFDELQEPAINVDETALAFGEVDINSEAEDLKQTFHVSGVNLSEGTLTIASNNEAFTVSPTSINVNGTLAATEVTVTPVTSAAGTFNGKITISGVDELSKEVSLSLTVNKLAAGISWAEDSKVGVLGEAYTHPTLNNPNSLMVSLSSTNKSVADFEEGQIVLKAAGTTTIKATSVETSVYAQGEVSYTLTVKEKYTITWHVNGATSTTEEVQGDIITPIADPVLSSDYEEKVFVGWLTTTLVTTDEAPEFVDFSALEASEDADYYAVFASGTPAATDYTELTDAAVLKAGDKLVITGSETIGMKAYDGSSNNCKTATIAIKEGKITSLGDACELVLGGTKGAWTLFDGTYYIYAAGTATSGRNYMKGKTSSDNDCLWTIATDEVKSVNNTYTPYMQYNSSSSLFSCYNTTSQSDVTLYHKASASFSAYCTTVAEKTYAVTLAATTNGTLVVKKQVGEEWVAITSGEAFVKNTSLTVVASPSSGYQLSSITVVNTETEDDVTDEVLSGTTLTVPAYAITVSASFDVASAIDNAEAEVKAVKFIENGQLFIEKNGHVYNVQGQIVK